MICVTHEMGFARQVANRVIFMDQGQIVEQNAPADFFDNPQHERTKLFLSQILALRFLGYLQRVGLVPDRFKPDWLALNGPLCVRRVPGKGPQGWYPYLRQRSSIRPWEETYRHSMQSRHQAAPRPS